MKSRALAAFVGAAWLLSSGTLSARFVEKDNQGEPVRNEQLEVRACGPKDKEVKYSSDTDRKQHPTPAQPADAALVYILRPTMYGQKAPTKFAVDGEWKGVNRGNNYFPIVLTPGEHYFCSKAQNRSVLSLTLEGGKTYFLQQHIQMGVMGIRNRLERMSDEEGRNTLKNANLSTWRVK
jgi:hypothetical protein